MNNIYLLEIPPVSEIQELKEERRRKQEEINAKKELEEQGIVFAIMEAVNCYIVKGLRAQGSFSKQFWVKKEDTQTDLDRYYDSTRKGERSYSLWKKALSNLEKIYEENGYHVYFSEYSARYYKDFEFGIYI